MLVSRVVRLQSCLRSSKRYRRPLYICRAWIQIHKPPSNGDYKQPALMVLFCDVFSGFARQDALIGKTILARRAQSVEWCGCQ